MDASIKIVRDHYDNAVESEWNRIAGRPEFLLTCKMFDRYIKPGDSVLDIGGGPGRYTIHLADKGCNVTLFDLSPENVKFASEQAAEQGLSIQAVAGDACLVDELVNKKFDHVLLMGPMYHLLEEDERVKAVNAALNVLKPGGIIYISFSNMMGCLMKWMKLMPEAIVSAGTFETSFKENFILQKGYAGDAFTKIALIDQNEILPFMSQFSLKKLHLFGQEGIMSPCEDNIMAQPKEVIDSWLDLCESLWEREEFLSWAEHLMYVGRKI